MVPPTPPPAARGRLLLLAAVLLALVVAAVSVLVGSRGGAPVATRPSPVRAPTQQPGPTPRSTFFDLVPITAAPSPAQSSIDGRADVVYIEVGASGAEDTLTAISWSGAGVGTIDLHGRGGEVVPSPDGRYLRQQNTVFSASGRPVATIPESVRNAVWAEDSRHLCGLDGRGRLQVIAVDGPTAAASGPSALVGAPEGSGIDCDPGRDVYLARQDTTPVSADALTVSVVAEAPSSGAVLARRLVCGPPMQCSGVGIVSAHDAVSVVAGGSDLPLTVVDVMTGSTRTFPIHGNPLTISWDGRRALVELADPPHTDPLNHVMGLVLVDLASGARLWSAPDTVSIEGFTAVLPGGRDLMIGAAKDGPSTGFFPPGMVRLILLDRVGHPRTLRTQITRLVGPFPG